ncbi:MAG: copper chaperone PCu(A)C [Anaerolineales bacterium]
MKLRDYVYVFLVFLLVLTACQPAAKGGIRIEKAWGRSSPKIATAGAFYMTIYNDANQDDKLVGGSSPACGMIELHETVMAPDGTMKMQPVAGGIPIPAKGKAELKVGGLHVMCMDKKAEYFEVGKKVPLTLQFEKGGALSIEVEIREGMP